MTILFPRGSYDQNECDSNNCDICNHNNKNCNCIAMNPIIGKRLRLYQKRTKQKER